MDRQSILLYDGVCNLCNGLVRFTIRWDRKKKISFASLQSETGQQCLKDVGLPTDALDTLVYLKAGKHYIRSSAVLEVLKDMGGLWRLFYIFIIVPGCIRDLLYRIVARLRYKIFGRSNECVIPPANIRDRFLDV